MRPTTYIATPAVRIGSVVPVQQWLMFAYRGSEPAEEIRLLALQLLQTLIQRGSEGFKNHIEEIISFLLKSIQDPFPELKIVIDIVPFSPIVYLCLLISFLLKSIQDPFSELNIIIGIVHFYVYYYCYECDCC